MHPMLNIAVKAARRAGGLINRAALDHPELTVRGWREMNRGLFSALKLESQIALGFTKFGTYVRAKAGARGGIAVFRTAEEERAARFTCSPGSDSRSKNCSGRWPPLNTTYL